MEKTLDLRRVLSENVLKKRKEMGLTQEKLAAAAGISTPYMTDIARCRTWVSDKTLKNLASALSAEPYELLIPQNGGQNGENTAKKRKRNSMAFVSNEINSKKREIKRFVSKTLDDLSISLLREL